MTEKKIGPTKRNMLWDKLGLLEKKDLVIGKIVPIGGRLERLEK